MKDWDCPRTCWRKQTRQSSFRNLQRSNPSTQESQRPSSCTRPQDRGAPLKPVAGAPGRISPRRTQSARRFLMNGLRIAFVREQVLMISKVPEMSVESRESQLVHEEILGLLY